MNAPSFWKDKYSALKELPDYAIAEIQRDAREGMVPVEEIRPLLEKVHTGEGLVAFRERLRAKHPNLFT